MEFPGCIAIGETAAETLDNLEEAARGWLSVALERNQNIPEPVENANDYSGKLALRIPRSLHKKSAWYAEREGVSLNQFIMYAISENVGEKRSSRGVYLGVYVSQFIPVPVNHTTPVIMPSALPNYFSLLSSLGSAVPANA